MPTAPPQPSLDRLPAPLLQDPQPGPWAVLTSASVGKGLPYRSRLRLRTLVAISARLNVILTVAAPGQRLALDWETALQLSYDTLQLAGMLYLTGGITNPFSMLLIAPAVLAAATLPGRYALVIGRLTLLASLLLAVMNLPLHSGGAPQRLPDPDQPDGLVHRQCAGDRHHRWLCLDCGF